MMINREKVIKGLECCIETSDMCWDKPTCPYNGLNDIYKGEGCMTLMMRDILALLKAQLAHIIPKDELIQRMKTPVWLDTKNGKVYTGWALTYDVQKGMGITGTRMGITDPSGRVHWLNLEDYGRTWRCWTAEPTEEQRKAAKWQ